MTLGHSLFTSVAQAAIPRATSGALLWSTILMVVVMVLGAALMVLRRKMFEPEETQSEAGLLETLREMNRRGQLSDEEFQAARRKMQDSIKRQVEQRAAELAAQRPKTKPPKGPARRPPNPRSHGNRREADNGSGDPSD